MRVTLKMDESAVINRLKNNISLAQFALDNQVIKDTEPYVPYKEGETVKSATLFSQIGKGIIIYGTIYSKKLYYSKGYKFRKDRNPLATDHWFEHSKAANKNKWLRVASKAGKFE